VMVPAMLTHLPATSGRVSSCKYSRSGPSSWVSFSGSGTPLRHSESGSGFRDRRALFGVSVRRRFWSHSTGVPQVEPYGGVGSISRSTSRERFTFIEASFV
jgi:hypothetical protein